MTSVVKDKKSRLVCSPNFGEEFSSSPKNIGEQEQFPLREKEQFPSSPKLGWGTVTVPQFPQFCFGEHFSLLPSVPQMLFWGNFWPVPKFSPNFILGNI